MALSCKVGTFTEKLTPGAQAYTGVGFQPKALVVFGNGRRTTDGTSAVSSLYIGVGTSSTARSAACIESQDALATSNANRAFETSFLLSSESATAGATAGADLDSLDADGFTLDWITINSPASARLHHYLALGGDDITDVKAGSFTSSASTGNNAITGIGFQPDAVLLFGTFATAAGIGANAILTIGGFTSATQWSVSYSDDDAEATTIDASRRQRTDKCFSLVGANGVVSMEGTFVTMGSDGFTINWTTASARLIGYLAIKGGSFKFGAISQKTTTGTQAYTGVGFEPRGVLFASFGDVASTSTQTHARLSLGAASSSSARAAVWAGSADGGTDSVADSAVSQTVAITMQTEGTPTEVARADLDSLDADGFTLDWEVADATAREVLYLAFGDEPPPPTFNAAWAFDDDDDNVL